MMGPVTISYIIEWTGFLTYTVTYSNGETKTIYGSRYISNIENQAKEYAKEIANEIAEERRMATPIGDCLYLLVFAIPYILLIFYKQYKIHV